jgi:membrane-associated phospholipid phosphatase
METVKNPPTRADVKRVRWLERARERLFHRRLARAVLIAVALTLFVAWLPVTARTAIAVGLFRNRASAVLLVLFSLLALSLLWSAGQELDVWVFTFFNARGSRPLWLDRAMWATTQLGNMSIALVVAAVLYLLDERRLAFELVLGLLSLWLLVEGVKAVTARERPFALLAEVRIIGLRAAGRSFPSGHTAQAFFVMSLLAHHFQLLTWAVAVLYLIAALVGVTRMYVGAHYPRDVIAGAMLGFLWGILISLMNPYL